MKNTDVLRLCSPRAVTHPSLHVGSVIPYPGLSCGVCGAPGASLGSWQQIRDGSDTSLLRSPPSPRIFSGFALSLNTYFMPRHYAGHRGGGPGRWGVEAKSVPRWTFSLRSHSLVANRDKFIWLLCCHNWIMEQYFRKEGMGEVSQRWWDICWEDKGGVREDTRPGGWGGGRGRDPGTGQRGGAGGENADFTLDTLDWALW